MAVDAATIKRLLEKVDADNRERIQLAINWLAKSRKRALDKPSASAATDLDKAKANLEQLVSQLQQEYFPEDAAPSLPNERFKNRAEAWRWCLAQGITISERKFRNDAKVGAYIVYPDKTVSRASVAEYMVRIMGSVPTPDLALIDHKQERERLELRKLQYEVDRLEIKARAEDAEWMLADDHWAQLLAGYNQLRGNLEHFARLNATEIVLEMGGDYHMGPLVAEKVVELVINKAFNELAKMQINSGVFEEIEEDEDERE
nr:hypothetical protein [uncultured Desulfobulbus sp.]